MTQKNDLQEIQLTDQIHRINFSETSILCRTQNREYDKRTGFHVQSLPHFIILLDSSRFRRNNIKPARIPS